MSHTLGLSLLGTSNNKENIFNNQQINTKDKKLTIISEFHGFCCLTKQQRSIYCLKSSFLLERNFIQIRLEKSRRLLNTGMFSMPIYIHGCECGVLLNIKD